MWKSSLALELQTRSCHGNSFGKLPACHNVVRMLHAGRYRAIYGNQFRSVLSKGPAGNGPVLDTFASSAATGLCCARRILHLEAAPRPPFWFMLAATLLENHATKAPARFRKALACPAALLSMPGQSTLQGLWSRDREHKRAAKTRFFQRSVSNQASHGSQSSLGG